ncbi:Cell wall protein IFF4, partial [Nakaseomyces glabratus]
MKRKPPFSMIKLWLVGILFIIVNVSAQAIIQTDTVVKGNNPSGYSNGYIILEGAYLAFQDMNTVPLYQTVRVNKGGALYYINDYLSGFSITSGHPIYVPFVFQNDGTVVVDDRKSTSPGSWTIKDGTFTNTGRMMFTSSQGDTFTIYSSSITNTGYIYSKGTNANRPQQFQLGNRFNTWINTGTVCQANTTYLLNKAIQGGGCITVGENSVFNVYNIDMQQQSIYLSHPSSVLALSNRQNVNVFGLGNGNGFLFPHFPVKKVSYNSLTGIATFTTGYGSEQWFTAIIGKGYDESKFEIIANINIQGENYNGNNFVIYNGPPPNPAPATCQPCVDIPLYSFKVPDPYVTTNEMGFTETVSFYSTYNEGNMPVVGTTTIFSAPDVLTKTKAGKSGTETDIISKVTGIDDDGSPFTYYTTVTAQEIQTDIITKTVTITNDDGSKSTITSVINPKDTTSSTTSSVPSASVETVTYIDGEGMEVTDIISPIITTSDGKPTTIFTTYAYDDGVDKTVIYTNGDALPATAIISHITTTGADGKLTTIVTTYPRLPNEGPDYVTTITDDQGHVVTESISHITTEDENGSPTIIITTLGEPATASDYTTVVTNSDGSVHTDVVSHITTTDAAGKPTTIVTTVPTSAGADYTTVVTNSDGSVHTDVVSHITTTDAAGKPTTIVTTVPTSAGADYTTVVTNSDGSVHTDVVSHITTTDAAGKPTTIVTTVPTSAGADYTTVVTNSDGSVHTDVVSHITTTDAAGKPTTIVTTVPTSAGADYTTVVTNSDGSVHTDVVSHITTTDSNG